MSSQFDLQDLVTILHLLDIISPNDNILGFAPSECAESHINKLVATTNSLSIL